MFLEKTVFFLSDSLLSDQDISREKYTSVIEKQCVEQNLFSITRVYQERNPEKICVQPNNWSVFSVIIDRKTLFS